MKRVEVYASAVGPENPGHNGNGAVAQLGERRNRTPVPTETHDCDVGCAGISRSAVRGTATEEYRGFTAPVPVEDLTDLGPSVIGVAHAADCQLCGLWPDEAAQAVLDMLENEGTLIWCVGCITRLRIWSAARRARS